MQSKTLAGKIILLSTIAVLIVGGFAYAYRHDLRDYLEKAQRGPLPVAVDHKTLQEQAEPETPELETPETPAEQPTTEPEPETEAPKPQPEPAPQPTAKFPAQFNLKVPFVVQAPYAVWDEIHEDGCEEASISMIKGFVEGKLSYTPEEMEAAIMAVVNYEDKTFGYNKDTTAEQTASIMRGFFGYENAEALPVTSWDDIKAQLIKGQPVVVPAYGKALHNPYFRNGGPEYHMLLIKGWTETKIITNDPGTKRGADLLYDPTTLMNALHDWNGGDVPNGAKMMLVANE